MNTDMHQMPGLAGITKLLEKWIGSTAYIIPLADGQGKALGNNGDRLMHAVFYKIIEELGIIIVDRPESAEVVVVPPNGALLEIYNFPRILQDQLKTLKDKPVVLFPSSAFFPTIDPSSIFDGRSAETLWILREQNSFAHLSEKWGSALAAKGVRLALDHDVVASGHKFVRDIVGDCSSKRPLVAARLDRESKSISSSDKAPAKDSATRSLQKRLAGLLPYGTLYTRLARLAKRTDLNAAGQSLVKGIDVDGRLEVDFSNAVFADISSPEYATFEGYLRLMADASVVVTDRLHVGLPAAILGKKVFLVEAGYHKLGGVYEQSLKEMPNVMFRQRT